MNEAPSVFRRGSLICYTFGFFSGLLGLELGLDLLRVFVDVFLSAHLLDLTGHAVGKRTQIIVGNLVGGFLLDFNRLAVNHLGLAFVRNDLSWLLQFTRTDDGGRNNHFHQRLPHHFHRPNRLQFLYAHPQP